MVAAPLKLYVSDLPFRIPINRSTDQPKGTEDKNQGKKTYPPFEYKKNEHKNTNVFI